MRSLERIADSPLHAALVVVALTVHSACFSWFFTYSDTLSGVNGYELFIAGVRGWESALRRQMEGD